MKKNILFAIGMTALACSCNDFLDREPMDAVPVEKYLLSENDLAAYTANLYNSLPSHKPGVYDIGVFATDNNSDNQAASNPEKLFVKGENRVAQSGGAWNFSEIRSANYFINRVRPLLEAGELGGNEANNKHYLGEAYFFRAFYYANKLDSLGDFPIIKTTIADNYEAVKQASQRRPRNEVARFIIENLDSAYYFMSNTPPASNRLTKDCAALLKSRVALFEGTWEKYHKGTARVPGGPGWPGAQKDYLKGFTIDIDAEIKYFLGEAKKAAQIVADNYQLYGNYPGLFRISRQQRIAKETEEIIFHTIYFEAGFPVFYYRITPRVTSFSIHSAPVGHFRITVGQPFTHQVIAGAIFLVRQHINMLDVLYIAAYSELPHHHIGNEQHKHQRDAQSCHVDQCKQLVAVKIGKISFQSFHRIL